MARHVFLSYSRRDMVYRDEVLPFLQSVATIRQSLWFDEQGLEIGDQFDARIQETLAETVVAILLLSQHFYTSDYITSRELPVLQQRAAERRLTLIPLYLTTLPEATVARPGAVDVRQLLSPHSPTQPLDRLDAGQRHAIYARLAQAVQDALFPKTERRQPAGLRYDLALTLQVQGNQWEHQFALPHVPRLPCPALECLSPATLLGASSALVSGEELFQLVFGADPQHRGALLGAACGLPSADPTRYPLRLRLRSPDDRLWRLPWSQIAYQGRPLAADGWTVEFHADDTPGFPEFPIHTCVFPGKVVLIGAPAALQTPLGQAHLTDVHSFFQQRWQQAPVPVTVRSIEALRAALELGSPRLVYYYGPVTPDGLPLAGADGAVQTCPWAELATWLAQARSVSALFLNVLGEGAATALPHGRRLLEGARAVLMQCHTATEAVTAARTALDWFESVFAAHRPLDPVVALYQHQRGHIAAWTRYERWQTVLPQRPDSAELVHLLLDRSRQRADVGKAKDDFYDFPARRVYHAVALGTQGSQVTAFPEMAQQHLRQHKRDQEVLHYRAVPVTTNLTDVQAVDDLVRWQFGIAPRQPLFSRLLPQDATASPDFWFVVLGWLVSAPLDDATHAVPLLQALVQWCQTCLLAELPASPQDRNIRVISLVALETTTSTVADHLEDHLAALDASLHNDVAFHHGELEQLAGVRLRDLRTYFQDPQYCGCDERYCPDFPALLLSGRPDMPFEEAVSTIRRGEPSNWGALFRELEAMQRTGAWPPPPPYQPGFWERYDGR